MKKRLISLFLVATTFLCVFSACSKNKDDGGKEESKVTITLSQSTLDLYEYEEAILSAAVDGSEDKVSWSVSEGNSVKVDGEGKITALTAGNAVVTAKAGGAEASCRVFVSVSPYAPVIEGANSVIGVTVGNSYLAEIYVSWNGEKLENTAFSVCLAEGAKEGVAEVSAENGTLAVAGISAGETEYSVFATVRGKLCEKTVKVNVYEKDVVFEPNSADFTEAEGCFETKIITEADDSGISSVVELDFSVSVDGLKISGAQIEWDINADYNSLCDKSKISVTGDVKNGYKVTGLSRGQTELTGKFSGNNSSGYVTVKVTVVTPVVRLSQSEAVFIQRKNPLYTKSDSVKGTLEAVEIGGKNAAKNIIGNTATLEAAVLSGTDNDLTETDLYVYTDKYCYVVPVKICTSVIKNKADLDKLKLVAGDNDKAITGYYVLEGDLDLGGAEMTAERGKVPYDAAVGFKGVLDGNGYSIKNFILGSGGIFGHVGLGAKIKDITFDNVTYKAISNAALLGCTVISATIENVTVNVAKYNTPAAAAKTDVAILGSRFFMSCTVQNVTVNASGVTFLNLFGHKCVENVFENFVINAAGYSTIGYNSDAANATTEIKALPDGVKFNVAA